MAEKCKFLLNWGLAFDEDRIIRKLNILSKEGWILKKMTLFYYKLVKGEPKELIYAMDYNVLKEDATLYFDLFENSGWQHRCSYGPFHFFSALPDAVPIYTDKENYLNKYKSVKQIYYNAAVVSTVIFTLTLLLQIKFNSKIAGTYLGKTVFLLGGASVVIAVPCLMVSAAYYFREKKVLKQK